MRVWKLGDSISAETMMRAAETWKPCWKVPGVDRRTMSRFVAEVSAGDVLFAGHDFATGPSAEQLAEFFNSVHIRAIVAKSFAPEFERAASKYEFALLSYPDAVSTYEKGEYAAADDWLIKFILEAGPDAIRREPQVEMDTELGRLVVDGEVFSFEPPVCHT